MSDNGNQLTTPPAVPPSQPAPDTQPGQQNGGSEQDPKWLPERLDRARKAAVTELLKELGLEKADELKTLITEARQIKQASMTESQKREADLEAARLKAETELQAARQETEQAKARAAELEQQRIADRLDAAISTAAQAARAQHPQDVVDLLRKGDLKDVVDDKGTVSADKVKALVDQARKDRPTWFTTGGVGSPSNRNGTAPEPNAADKEAAKRALAQNLRNKF